MDYPNEHSVFVGRPNDLKRGMQSESKTKKMGKPVSKVEKKIANRAKYHVQVTNPISINSALTFNKPSTENSNGLFGGNFTSNSLFSGNGSQNMWSNFNNS